MTLFSAFVPKRPIKLAIREGIALQLHPSWHTGCNADITTVRITSTGRLDRIGYQIRQDGSCDIRLKHDGQGENDVGDQLIKNETAITVAIDIVIAVRCVIEIANAISLVWTTTNDRDQKCGCRTKQSRSRRRSRS